MSFTISDTAKNELVPLRSFIEDDINFSKVDYSEKNPKNIIKYKFGDLLLHFIYSDYSALLSKLKNNIDEFLKFLSNNTLNKDLILNKISTISDINITSYDIDFGVYKMNDPYVHLFLYEINSIYNEIINTTGIIDSDEIIDDTKLKLLTDELEKVTTEKIKIFSTFQSIFFDAICICFDTSFRSLSHLTIEERISYYINSPNTDYSFIIFNLDNNIKFNKKYMPDNPYYCPYKKIPDNEMNIPMCFDMSDIPLSEISSSFNITGRETVIYYDKNLKKLRTNHIIIKTQYINNKHKVFSHIIEPSVNLNVPNNIPKYISVLQFHDFCSLCYFEFSKLIEFKDENIIKECKLCQKIFIAPSASRQFCDNIFDNNKKCFDVGSIYFEQIKNNSSNKSSFVNIKLKYSRIYKKVQNAKNRKGRKDKLNDYHIECCQYKLCVLKKLNQLYKIEAISYTIFDEFLNIIDNLKLEESLKKNADFMSLNSKYSF